jgi:hypothetical protein
MDALSAHLFPHYSCPPLSTRLLVSFVHRCEVAPQKRTDARQALSFRVQRVACGLRTGLYFPRLGLGLGKEEPEAPEGWNSDGSSLCQAAAGSERERKADRHRRQRLGSGGIDRFLIFVLFMIFMELLRGLLHSPRTPGDIAHADIVPDSFAQIVRREVISRRDRSRSTERK